jgi:hypothetical protein
MTVFESRTPPDRYEMVFLLLMTSFVATAVLSSPRARVVDLVLYLGALVLTMRTVRFQHRTALLVRWGLAAGTAIIVLLILVIPSRLVAGLAALWTAGILVFIFAMIVGRILQHRVVSLQTILGALSAYLLVGFLFTALFAATDRLTAGPLFAGGGPTNTTEIQYFAFITLTTTGYGDLTPAHEPARSLAVLDALCGQIFLVTLVARLVSVFGTVRRRPGDEAGPAEAGPADADL